MASNFRHVKLFTTPWSIVRHNSKPNIKRTRIPHWVRLNVLETTKPVFLPEVQSPAETCELTVKSQQQKLSKYHMLLSKELMDYLDNSAFVGIYHANSIKGRPMGEVMKLCRKYKFHLGTEYTREFVKIVIKGTKYEAISPLFDSEAVMVFSNTMNIDGLLTFHKKVPHYILLAAILENRLMSKEDFDKFANLPTLDIMRAQFCATLNSFGVEVIRNLNHHQTQLTHYLIHLEK